MFFIMELSFFATLSKFERELLIIGYVYETIVCLDFQ